MVNPHQSRERTESLIDTSSLAFACRPRLLFPACVACSHWCQVKERHRAWDADNSQDTTKRQQWQPAWTIRGSSPAWSRWTVKV